MITYDKGNSAVITTTTPRISFDGRVPNHFINEFLVRMSKGQIRITDYQGNELKVYYDASI
jgi:hypothetical protein